MAHAATYDGTTAEPEALRSDSAGAERRAACLVEQVSDSYFVLDDAFRFVTVNRAAERALGMSRETMLGRTHWDVFPGSEDYDLCHAYRRAMAVGGEVHLTLHYEGEGRDVYVEVDAYPDHECGGAGPGLAILWRDVTDRVRANQAAGAAQADLERRVAKRTTELARANAQLQAEIAERARAQADRDALLRRLASAQEDERRHLARELHDEVGQHLTALGLGLRALADMVAPESEVDRRVHALHGLVSTLGEDLHALAVQLRPRALDDFGLETALAAYAEAWSRRYGITVRVHTRVETDRLAPAVESAVYRIAQEALTNVARHSGAARAEVIVERRDGHVCVTVQDDGRGFDPAAPVAQRAAGGLGLLGIRERATLLHGTVDVESAPAAGTTLFVRIPFGCAGGGEGEVRDDAAAGAAGHIHGAHPPGELTCEPTSRVTVS